MNTYATSTHSVAGVRGLICSCAMASINAMSKACLSICIIAALGVSAQPQFPTVLDALNNLDGFAFLGSTVGIANFTNLLSDPNLTAIILAPDDTAFSNTLMAFPGAASLASDQTAAGLVLSYHLIPTSTPNAFLNITNATADNTFSTALSAVNDPAFPEFQTFTLANLTFKIIGENLVYVGGLPPGGIIDLTKSVTAGNSRIYSVTGGVLVPPSKNLTVSTPPINLTIAEALTNAGSDFSIVASLIAADPVLTAFINDPDQEVTLFAPTNTAAIATLSFLNLSASDLLGSDLARRVVLNHIVPLRPFLSTQLPNGATILSTASSVATDTITITSNDTTVTVQGLGNPQPIPVIIPNIGAGKSVIHAINFLILPNTTVPTAPNGTTTIQTFNGTLTGAFNGTVNGTTNATIVGFFNGTIAGTFNGTIDGTVNSTTNGTFFGLLNGAFNGTLNGVQFNGTLNGTLNGTSNGTLSGSGNFSGSPARRRFFRRMRLRHSSRRSLF